MKRIAIFCDGTWNKSDAPEPTNVVRLARAALQTCTDAEKTKQVILYFEGVGSGRGSNQFAKATDRILGGMLGWGLMENIKDAYRALIFNYEPGDELYIFGFSRGAYTARSLAGLIRKAGILPRDHRVHCPEVAKDRLRFTGEKTEDIDPDHALFTDPRHNRRPDIGIEYRVATGLRNVIEKKLAAE